jgi:addiction module RelE/StbE family toxin
MKVVWTKTALSHLTDIYDYIARDSPRYAQRMVDRLTDRSRQIQRFPQSGHVVPEYDDALIRELIEGPYRLIYRVEPLRIVVLAVVHGSRLLPLSPPK